MIAMDVKESTESDELLLANDRFVQVIKLVMTGQTRLPDKDYLRDVGLYYDGLKRAAVFLFLLPKPSGEGQVHLRQNKLQTACLGQIVQSDYLAPAQMPGQLLPHSSLGDQ
jgi:hypothetical protein